jgi:hypothetical protein
MSSSESVGVALATVSDGSTHSFDGKMLSKLIAAASASLDNDRVTKKEYRQRAAELMRVSRKKRRTAPTAFSYVRGGLASWQKGVSLPANAGALSASRSGQAATCSCWC